MSIFSKIFDRIITIKDKPVSFAAKIWLNKEYERYGVMTKLEINSQNKSITAELELKGESEPLTITIGKYELSHKEDNTFIEFKKISTSREWINVLLNEFLPERKFEVPAAAKIIL